MSKLIALLSGVIFGLGLIVSEMVNPAKVIAFLDLAGAWNPSLGLVMAGAIAVALPAFYVAKRKKNSVCGMEMHLPNNKIIDTRLIVGSLTFGVGWGVAGFCPAPALVSAAAGQWQAIVFSLAMIVGFYIFSVLERKT
ncbi:MAG: YeeE/YedE family protein [Moraxellaceae bacterium]|nr:YeeE/YedE family protein [Moraxellaceae bacterium]MBK8326080.1 YeeE/YedE family protein [Moraxellaceae bacterium]